MIKPPCVPPSSNVPPPIGPADMAALDPCAMLNIVQAEYLKLISGQNRTRVKFGGSLHASSRESDYGRGDAQLLRAEVRRLEALCNQRRGGVSAVQAGPPRPLGAFPLSYPPFRFRGF